MLCIYPQNECDYSDGTGIALGNFDGLHIGHMKLIDTVIKFSRKKGLKSMVYTFENHPLNIINNSNIIPKIITNHKKIELLEQMELDSLYFEKFDEAYMKLSPEEFVKGVLIDKLKAKLIVVGFNFTFGYKGKGDTNLLKKLGEKYNIEIVVIQPVEIFDQVVSSSLIRQIIKNGEIEKATMYLNRYFAVSGEVILGKRLGNKLGFPTANLFYDRNYLIPKYGTYITRTKLDGKYYKSVTNVGVNPTVNDTTARIETHIIGFNNNIYKKHMEVEFIKRLREEMKFNNIQKLKKQILEDINCANEYFGNCRITIDMLQTIKK